MANLWNAMHLNDPKTSRAINSFGRNEFSGQIPDMSTLPWSTKDPRKLMEFKSITNTPVLHTKRKTAPSPPPVPCKKMLTEESMAAHLNNLHISSVEPSSSSEMSTTGDSMNDYKINMYQWDLERKLRTAQKITISKEVLELDKNSPDNIFPEILLNRITKPCSALVLWQPPPASLESLIAIRGDGDVDVDNRSDSSRINESSQASSSSSGGGGGEGEGEPNSEEMET